MAIRRIDPKPHVVIVDTNVLWHEDKKHAVSPDFEAAWYENQKLVTLELLVPEIVRHELAFQQTTAAWNRLDQITRLLAETSGIAAVAHTTRITREKLRAQVEDKIDKGMKSHRARLLPVPYAAVDWKRLTMDAVWRRPPFTFDPKKVETEKGFRDALVLETVADYTASDSRALAGRESGPVVDCWS